MAQPPRQPPHAMDGSGSLLARQEVGPAPEEVDVREQHEAEEADDVAAVEHLQGQVAERCGMRAGLSPGRCSPSTNCIWLAEPLATGAAAAGLRSWCFYSAGGLTCKRGLCGCNPSCAEMLLTSKKRRRIHPMEEVHSTRAKR